MIPLPRLGAVLLLVLTVLTGCKDGTGRATTGGLTITVSGLPGGASAVVTVTGPNAYSRTLTGSEVIDDLKPGEYTITASTVTVGSASYGAIEETQTTTVTVGGGQRVEVAYVDLNTTLTVTVRGLAEGVKPALRVVGPNGFSREINGSARLAGLVEGTYTIIGAGLLSGDSTYQARPIRQDYVMTGYYPGVADIVYSAAGTKLLNFKVSGMYLLNVVQTANGAVPVLENRDAFVRVFVTTDQPNTASPWVRIRLYHGAALQRTLDLAPGSSSVPAINEEGSLERSWNIVIPAEVVRPGLRVEAEVDPDNGVIEADESDNVYPGAAGPQSINVVSPTPLQIRFVPVVQSANGLSGNISESNKTTFLGMTQKLFPLPTQYQADVRAPYTTGAPALGKEGTGWDVLLTEIAALRVAEVGGRSPMHYYGVVRVGYSSGVAGMAFIPQSPTPGGAAIGWDYLPSGDEVVAHELGHNFGRRHAPCGAAGGPDPAYPHNGGIIGNYGYDIPNRRLRRPEDKDLMGYCNDPWISDYTYEAVRNFRAAAAAQASQQAIQSTVLVWGRVNDREAVIEPAFQLRTRPSLPTAGGPLSVQGFDETGATLFSLSFAGEVVDHGNANDRIFAFAVPLSADRAARLASLRFTGRGRSATVRSTAASAPGRESPGLRDQALTLTPDGDEMSLRWDRTAHPMVMVRDASTGEILSFARGGRVDLPSVTSDLELLLSDGSRSIARRVRVGVN